MWEKDLICQLNWQQRRSQPRAITERHRAPSSSWAAVDDEIIFSDSSECPLETFLPSLKLLSVRTWDAPVYNENELAFPRGFARIESTLYRGVIWKTPRSTGTSEFTITVRISGWSSQGYRSPIKAHLDYDYNDLSPQVYLMPVSIIPRNHESFVFTAILMQRCVESTLGPLAPRTALFQRVGVVTEFLIYSSPLSEIFSEFRGKKMRMKEDFEDRRVEVKDEHSYTHTPSRWYRIS
jgi:hypothetical protein